MKDPKSMGFQDSMRKSNSIQRLKEHNIEQKYKRHWVEEQRVLVREQGQKHVFIAEKQPKDRDIK